MVLKPLTFHSFFARFSNHSLRSRSGFTMMELMIGLAIMLVALLSVSPFAKGWINQSRQNQNIGIMRQAIAKTRALAQRNPLMVTGTNGSATLCLSSSNSNAIVYLHPGVPSSCGISTGTNAYLWSATLTGRSDVSLSMNTSSTAFTCIVFSNFGTSVTGSMGATNCPVVSTFGVTVSSVSSSQMPIF